MAFKGPFQLKQFCGSMINMTQPPPLFFQISQFVSILPQHDQIKIQCLKPLTTHVGMSLFQLQKENGSTVKTEGKAACSVCTEPINEFCNTWLLGQTQVPSSDVGMFINNAKEKKIKTKQKQAALVFCEEKKDLHCWLTAFVLRLEQGKQCIFRRWGAAMASQEKVLFIF